MEKSVLGKDLGCKGDPHARVRQCPLPCPSTCEVPDPVDCKIKCDPVGCECEPGYILSESNGRCILPDECKGGNPCGSNGTFAPCTSFGSYDYCPVDDSRDVKICDFFPFTPCYPGCICKQNYKRLSFEDSRCVLASDCHCCPRCGINEEPFVNEVRCPPDTCESIYSSYACEGTKPTKCGCKCISEHLRNSSKICIPSDQCPPPKPVPQCGVNEEPFENEVICPPDTCESIYTSYACEGVKPTAVGCKCINEHLRNSNNICVPSDQCPPPKPIQQCGVNEEPFENEVICPPDTCESTYTSYACEGVKPTEVGCKCINGYLRNSSNVCVLSDQCPPPNPCGPNGTFADCGFRCPNQYCPQDDSQETILCKPPRECPPDCLCKDNYKRISMDDDTCVLASDCPPVNCTRPNEVWNPCTRCLAEKCEDINVPNVCDDLSDVNCEPKCVCAKGHCRNEERICVPIKKCPIVPFIPNECIPTCAVPNPKNCKYVKPATTADEVCNSQCKEGYIMSKLGGKCIKVEDCPKDSGCNGDPHARVKLCPQPCPSTCSAPNASPCKRKCDPIGCECEPGYILSKINGKCILPDDCKGGNPCGPNARFVECRSTCPYDYCPVDDSLATVVCEYYPFSPCFSGCTCDLNHKRLSRKDDRCVVSSDCPPVNCTRPNEVWNSCPSDCWSEICEDVDQERGVCNTFVLNCQPRCVCEENFFRRNPDRICVSANECRKLNANNESSNA